MSDRPVVVRLSDGCEYGLPSVAEAKRVYPTGEIIRYQDGTAYEPDEAITTINTSGEPELVVSNKLTREQLEEIATQLGIEGADNKTAYPNKDALVEAIEAQPINPPHLWATPGFVDMSREDLETIARVWFSMDPDAYPADEYLRLALVAAYEADTDTSGDAGEPE